MAITGNNPSPHCQPLGATMHHPLVDFTRPTGAGPPRPFTAPEEHDALCPFCKAAPSGSGWECGTLWVSISNRADRSEECERRAD